MGAENSILNDCEWGEEFSLSANHDWTLQHATTQNGLDVTVFNHKRKDRKEIDLLKKSSKYLKTLRHPSILRFIASGESSEGSYLITEEVLPLSAVLQNLSPVEICAGIYEILEALAFLHDKVGMCHNNICLSSIYVRKDGSWKLGGLEHCCQFEEATIQFLEKCRAFRNEESISPEEKAGKFDNTKECGHVGDVYSFGILVDQLIEHLDGLGDVCSNFERRIHSECLNIEASKRPKLQTLLNDSIFRNDFTEIIKFLKNITVKEENERKEFFSGLTSKLLALPESLVATRLTHLLMSRFILLDNQANKFLVPHLLTPAYNEQVISVKAGKTTPIFSCDVFRQTVIPLITKIFYIREKHIRLVLLHHFTGYVHLFDKHVLQDLIFPHLLLGLRDSDDAIVSASLRGLADIVPILGGDIVIGGSRKQFFTEGLPKLNGRKLPEDSSIKTNVENVIEKKILLKDLAGMGKPSADVEKKRKMAERDQRREAARQKREEKRLKLKEQEKTVLKITGVVLDEERKNEEKTTEEISEITDNTVTMVTNGTTERYQNVELYEEEDRADDWSDWEDTDKNDLDNDLHQINGNDLELNDLDDNVSVVSEGAISDEIESQLLNMPTTIPVSPTRNSPRSPNSNLSQSSPNSFQKSPISPKQISPSSSSVQSKSKPNSLQLKKSALQLKHKKDKNDKKDVKILESSSSYIDKDWGLAPIDSDLSLGNNHVTKTDQSTTSIDSRRSSTSTGSSASRNLPKTSFNLGEEFDIKSVKIKPNEGFDFFSDMTPDIKPQKTVFDQLLGGQSLSAINLDSTGSPSFQDKHSSPDKLSVKSDKFSVISSTAVSEVQEETGDGWGADEEDLDWGSF